MKKLKSIYEDDDSIRCSPHFRKWQIDVHDEDDDDDELFQVSKQAFQEFEENFSALSSNPETGGSSLCSRYNIDEDSGYVLKVRSKKEKNHNCFSVGNTASKDIKKIPPFKI